MKNKLLATILVLSLMISTMAFAMHTSPVSADNDHVTLSITPNPINKNPGDSFFDVYVNIADVTDLFGFDIKITWDNSLITFSSLTKYNNILWPGKSIFEPLGIPGYQTGAGYVRYAVLATYTPPPPGFTGSGDLFSIRFNIVKSCNFPLSTPISFDTVKLSDSQANVIDSTKTGATYSMSATVPDLEFNLVNLHPSKPWEYCKYFEIEVYASHICAQLTDYDLKVNYNSELLAFIDVDGWGVFGVGHVDHSVPGVVRVYSDAGSPITGDQLLLFKLTFHIEFDDGDTHIWRTNNQGPLTALISLDATYGELSFVEGILYVDGHGVTSITLPSAVPVTVNLIQGDINCDGWVNILDLGTVAGFYDQANAKYDLRVDGIIDIYDLVLIANRFMYHNPDTP